MLTAVDCLNAHVCPQDFVVPRPYKKFVPLPSAVSIPFFIGAPIAIDFCLGGAIMLAWCAPPVGPLVAFILWQEQICMLLHGAGLRHFHTLSRPVHMHYITTQNSAAVVTAWHHLCPRGCMPLRTVMAWSQLLACSPNMCPFCRRIVNPTTAQLLGIPAGAGLMVGDGLWQLPLGILGVTKVVRPVCVAYFRGQRQGAILNG